VHVTGVATDSHDNVVIAGYYESSIDLFGQTFVAHFAEPGRVTGAFVVKLDATGQLVWQHGDLGFSEATDVAVDPQDNVIVVGASTVNTGFFQAPVVAVFDPAGGASSDRYEAAAAGSEDGRAVSVVVDACGSFYVGMDKLEQVAPPGPPIRAYVVKYSRVP